MMHFIFLLQSTQNRHRVIKIWLADVHRLKSSLERSVFFDVLAIFCQCSRADHVQFSARQRWFQDIACVHAAFAAACANHGVDLVDEQDDLARGLVNLFEYGFEALFKLSPKRCASNER